MRGVFKRGAENSLAFRNYNFEANLNIDGEKSNVFVLKYLCTVQKRNNFLKFRMTIQSLAQELFFQHQRFLKNCLALMGLSQ